MRPPPLAAFGTAKARLGTWETSGAGDRPTEASRVEPLLANQVIEAGALPRVCTIALGNLTCDRPIVEPVKEAKNRMPHPRPVLDSPGSEEEAARLSACHRIFS